MESLALVVTVMLSAEVLFALAVIVFAAVARVRARFQRTALVLIVLLTLETAWALWVLPAFGVPSLIALVVSVATYWWPKRRSSTPRS